MFRPRRRPRVRGPSFNRLIPNILTLLALCAGLTAIRYGILGRWQPAVLAIFLAAVLDGLDGRIARLLHGTSKFGAELDSLSDFVSFGVAPAMVLYLWTMSDARGIGWALTLLFAVSCALRLARFNTMLGESDLPAWAGNYFTGVPAPAAAGLVLLPMMMTFEAGPGLFDNPAVVGVFLVGVSVLMISRVPTYSFKRVRVPQGYVAPLLVCVGVLTAFLVTEPWLTFTFLGFVYLASIPVAVRSFRRLSADAKEMRGEPLGQDDGRKG